METQSANSRSGCVCGRISLSLKNWMLRMHSCSVCCCLAWETFRYSQDWNAKNIPNPVYWTIVWSSLEICCLAKADITNIGIAFWCFSAGSSFLNALSSHCRRNPGLPSSSMDGLGLLCLWMVWHTCEMALAKKPWASLSWDDLEKQASCISMAKVPSSLILAGHERLVVKE